MCYIYTHTTLCTHTHIYPTEIIAPHTHIDPKYTGPIPILHVPSERNTPLLNTTTGLAHLSLCLGEERVEVGSQLLQRWSLGYTLLPLIEPVRGSHGTVTRDWMSLYHSSTSRQTDSTYRDSLGQNRNAHRSFQPMSPCSKSVSPTIRWNNHKFVVIYTFKIVFI